MRILIGLIGLVMVWCTLQTCAAIDRLTAVISDAIEETQDNSVPQNIPGQFKS